MSEQRDRLRACLNPESLFFVPETDTRASIFWADCQIGRLERLLSQARFTAVDPEASAELTRLKGELGAANLAIKDLRTELGLYRDLVSRRSEAVKKIAEKLVRTAS